MKSKDFAFNSMTNLIIIATTLFLAFMLYSLNRTYEVDSIRERERFRHELIFMAEEIYADWDAIDWYEQFVQHSDMTVGNWRFNAPVEVGEDKENCSLLVFFCMNEGDKYVLASGSLWDPASPENAVIIGSSFLNRTYQSGGKTYLTICEEECPVIGILADDTGMDQDDRILINYANLTTSMESKLFPLGEVYASSDKDSVYAYEEEICDWLSTLYGYPVYCDESEYEYHTDLNDYLFRIMVLISLIAIYNSFLISRAIFERYKKDLVIMRMCGMSVWQILGHFYQKIWYCYIASLLLVVVICKSRFVLLVGLGVVSVFVLTTLLPVLTVLRKKSLRRLETTIFEVI